MESLSNGSYGADIQEVQQELVSHATIPVVNNPVGNVEYGKGEWAIPFIPKTLAEIPSEKPKSAYNKSM